MGGTLMASSLKHVFHLILGFEREIFHIDENEMALEAAQTDVGGGKLWISFLWWV